MLASFPVWSPTFSPGTVILVSVDNLLEVLVAPRLLLREEFPIGPCPSQHEFPMPARSVGFAGLHLNPHPHLCLS